MNGQLSIFEAPAPRAEFDGSDYSPGQDRARLASQLERVRAAIRDGAWRTLDEIQRLTDAPQASISAQLRNLRKARFGSCVIERRARGERSHGLYEYRLVA